MAVLRKYRHFDVKLAGYPAFVLYTENRISNQPDTISNIRPYTGYPAIDTPAGYSNHGY